jgi:hypothetical protein
MCLLLITDLYTYTKANENLSLPQTVAGAEATGRTECRPEGFTFFLNANTIYIYIYVYSEVPKLWGAPPPPVGGGDVGLLGGASYLYEWHIYFERNMGAR